MISINDLWKMQISKKEYKSVTLLAHEEVKFGIIHPTFQDYSSALSGISTSVLGLVGQYISHILKGN